MNLFTKKKKPEVASSLLLKKASDTLSVFKKAIEDLRSVVKEAVAAKSKNEVAIAELEVENAHLNEVINTNSQLVDRFTDLLSPNSITSEEISENTFDSSTE